MKKLLSLIVIIFSCTLFDIVAIDYLAHTGSLGEEIESAKRILWREGINWEFADILLMIGAIFSFILGTFEIVKSE